MIDYDTYIGGKIEVIMRAYGLSEFASKDFAGEIESCWAKDLDEARRIISGQQSPYSPWDVSNELYRNGKISAATAL